MADLAAGYVLDLIWHVPIAPPGWSFIVRLAGALVVASGFWIMLSAVALFRRLGTKLAPWEPASKLALSGPYRFTRNPMYLGMALIVAGLALVGNAVWPLLALVPVVDHHPDSR